VSRALDIPVLSARSLPHEKQAWVKSLQKKGGKVAMVRSYSLYLSRFFTSNRLQIGDGINDSLAQATADVGILLSVSRTCMTGAADVIVMTPSLEAVPKILDIAKVTVKQAKWNIKWAIGYNAVAVSLASGIFEAWGLIIDA
jgi:Cu+-exporting ATPase